MRSTAAGTFYNLAGRLAPAAVAIFCVPPILRQLGPDRFGLLTLAWVVVGYFSILDLGLGRALTQAIAAKRSAAGEGEVPALIWTSMALLLALGALTAVALILTTPWIVEHALKTPPQLRVETISSLRYLALSLPFVMMTAALRGVLEAQQEFGLVNALRIPMVLATFVAPIFILPFACTLTAVVITLLIGRLVTFVGH